MNKLIGAMLMAIAWLAQMQMQACAQSADQLGSQAAQPQPGAPAQLDGNLRGAIGGQTTAQSSAPLPFTATSPYSYSEPAGAGFDPQGRPALSAPVSVQGAAQGSTGPVSKKQKQKKHGFSPVGAVFGVQDRAVKSSLGLTDRTAKAGLGITGKTTKEIFKAIF